MTKTAVVTGASRGIGRAVALRLAQDGNNVVVNYLFDEEDYAGIVKEIEALGMRAIAIKADVSKFDEVREMMEKAKEEFGTIDILVNNAGITRDGLLARMKEEDFDAVINAVSYTHLAQAEKKIREAFFGADVMRVLGERYITKTVGF